MSEMLANQLLEENRSLKEKIDQCKAREALFVQDIKLLLKTIKLLKARKTRLLSDNRKSRKQVKKLEEQLVAARQQLRNFQRNTTKGNASYSPFLLDAAGGW